MNVIFSAMSVFMVFFVIFMIIVIASVLLKSFQNKGSSNNITGMKHDPNWQDDGQQMFMNQMMINQSNNMNLMPGDMDNINRDSDHDGIPDIVDPNPYSFDNGVSPDASASQADNNYGNTDAGNNDFGNIDMGNNDFGSIDMSTTDFGNADIGN